MPRFFLGWLLGLGGNAVGLILASLILGDNFHFTSVTGFVVSLVIFAILSGLFTWMVLKFLIRNAGSIVALTGLIATFLALLLTTVLPWGGLTINGMGWVWGTLIVWVCGMFIWLIPGPWRNFKKEAR
jgi:hypothetical protein